MVRLIKFLGFWSLLLVGGLAAVALSTFAATFLRSEGIVTAVVVVGLACVFPVSLAVASSRFYPARPAPWSPAVCPHCNGQVPTHDPKAPFELWPY